MSFDLEIKNGDINIERDGSISSVNENKKLRQDIVKILLTEVSSNGYHKFYGSRLGSIQIGDIPDPRVIEADIASSAEDAIGNLIRLQRIQSKKQFIGPGEFIVSVQNIDVSRDTNDPRQYNVAVTVLTRKLTHVTESVTVKLI
jgi:hypothetical protein